MRIITYSWTEYKSLSLQASEDLFHSLPFLENFAIAYRKNIKVFCVYTNERCILSLPVLHQGKDASLSTHFFYQAILVHEHFSERTFLQAWELLISELKLTFDAIDFKLPPFAIDIRPFTWAGFGQKSYYTAIIQLTEAILYSENVRRSIKKAEKAALQVRVNTLDEELLKQNIDDMLLHGLGASEPAAIQTWIHWAAKSGHCTMFELINAEGATIGSSIYLYDTKQAYLISVMGGEEQSGGQAYLYHKAFEHFKSLGLEKIDLLGANIPSIALYKSKLGASAESYSIVSYRKSFSRYFFSYHLKKIIKKVLKSLRIINK